MRLFLQLFLYLAVTAFCATSAFESRTVSSVGLSDAEARRYERQKKMPGVKRVKLIAINTEEFSNGSWTEIPMFDNATDRFRVFKDEREQVWRGRSGKNFDRFVVRNISGRYSGHILFKGRQYVIIPVKKGVSALLEINANVECGMDALKGRINEQ